MGRHEMISGGMLVLSLLCLSAQPKAVDNDHSSPNLRCGAFCLYLSLRSLDFEIKKYEEVETKLGQPGRLGYSMEELAKVAKSYGASVQGVDSNLDNLMQRTGRFACVALLDRAHFVNVYDVHDGRVYVVDPPSQREIPVDAFRQIWTGKALIISDRSMPSEPDVQSNPLLISRLTYVVIIASGMIFITILVRYARRSPK